MELQDPGCVSQILAAYRASPPISEVHAAGIEHRLPWTEQGVPPSSLLVNDGVRGVDELSVRLE